MEVDYIIVGQGLAGTCIARSLEKKGSSFIIINEFEDSCSSRVAAGIFNPITGKRLVKTWMADQIFPFAKDFYSTFEKDLEIDIIRDQNVYKPYTNPAEENDITGKSADENFAKYLNLKFDHKLLSNQIHNEDGGVEILHAGSIRLPVLIDEYTKYLSAKNQYLPERFDANKLTIEEDRVTYDTITAKKIIFCEGHQATENDLFSWLPFTLTKGEILELEINDFQNERIINRGGFLLPQGENKYLAGASYERKINKEITEKGRDIVREKIDGFLKVPYKITGQRVGIRPTVKDRRPFLGTHPRHNNVYIFNGLGTKGVTIGPWFSNHLAEHLVNNSELMDEANISRYYSLYSD